MGHLPNSLENYFVVALEGREDLSCLWTSLNNIVIDYLQNDHLVSLFAA